MRKTLALIAATAALATTPALAQDWTGGYVGGQLGFGDIDTSVAGANGDGVIGGLVAGYDYDLGDWVIGAGIDYDFADINITGAADLESIWRLKVRGGYKIGNGLLYATTGYANADIDTVGDDDGYFIGAGYEHLITQNFSLGGELLYHEFDNFAGTTTDVEATTIQVRGTFRF